MKKINLIKISWLIVLAGCLEPYLPPVINSGESLLVVDGMLSSSDGTCTVSLSRTQDLTDTNSTPYETGATILLADEDNATYPLTEEAAGTYYASGLPINPSKKYKLTINTQNGKIYESDFVTIKNTPPIDSVNWQVAEDNGVQIYVNTHDPSDKTLYYLWKCEETWSYTAPYQSFYHLENGYPIYKENNTYQCWQSKFGYRIGTSSNLSEDVIHNFPLIYIYQKSEKLQTRYSVLVKQYGLTKEAYQYWVELQKNSESLGTLFDPQPSQVRGNLHCVSNPTEIVPGYFNAGTLVEKRIFISSLELPRPATYDTGYETCAQDTLFSSQIPYLSGDLVLTTEFFMVGYGKSTIDCVDCRLKGGTTIKPDFW